ncbi:MAG: peptidoglycan-binding protein [Gammaproteobacteria bacterium]
MRAEFLRLAWLALVLALLGIGGAPAWAAPDPDEVAETIRRTVEQLRSTGEATIAGRKLLSARGLPEIYEARGFLRLWSDPGNEEALLGEIAAASGDGLNPEDYHFDALRTVLDRRRQEPDSPGLAASADMLLTDALLRLAVHFHLGKLDPATGQARWDLAGTVRGEPGAAVVTRMATGRALPQQLGELRPVQPLYGRFKSALARYRVIEQADDLAPLPAGRVLQLGMEDARVPLLRRRLAATGDFAGIVLDSPRFEPALEEAVRRFQARHRLKPDGVFGPASQRELNRPIEERIDQLMANLERARWMLAEVRGRFLVIDPPGRRVVLMDNSQPVLVQDAAFTAAAASAREFRTDMHYLVVHPDWVLPPPLVEAQVAPLARRAPAQLEPRGLQVFNAAGEPVAPARADWSRPSTLVVRQLPGARNFLGNLRFSMPNAAGIFLHGGPAEGDALAGSIRLEDPEALARALAGPPAPWTSETLSVALAGGAPRTLLLGRPVPVLYGYWSAWVDTGGMVSFRIGYEDRDALILAGLRRAAGAP